MNQPDRLPHSVARAAEDAVRHSLLGHDLRAAMSDIIGGLRLIDQSGMDDGTRLQLERVRAAGETLARLLEEALTEMLDEGDLAPALPANIQMSRFLHDLEMRWSGRAREKGIGFQIAVAPDVPQVLSLDRIALERVLSNLLSNAVKHTDSGMVRLEVRVTAEGALRIRVTDQGPGFSDQALARLFQYAARPEGAAKPGHGLGMHISKTMTGRLGGTIRATNRPEGGAEVTLDLPADAWEAREPEEGVPLPDLSSVKVLVAEDTPTNQALIGQMLARMGAEFEIAEDGVEALEWLDREDFDLVLVDIEMPRLSGIEVIRTMRAPGSRHARVPVVAVTAYVLRANRDAIYAAGADAILAKPLAGLDAFGLALGGVLGRLGATPPALSDRAAEAAELDRGRLDHLLGIAGPEAARELLDRLAEDLGRTEHGLIAGLRDGDLSAVRANTHVLISLAGAVGAERLQKLSEALNASAHRREDAAMKALGQQVLAQLDRLIHVVARERAERGETP